MGALADAQHHQLDQVAQDRRLEGPLLDPVEAVGLADREPASVRDRQPPITLLADLKRRQAHVVAQRQSHSVAGTWEQ